MSKKTRKKSSKTPTKTPAMKPRKASARKPPAAKAARGGLKASAKKPAAKAAKAAKKATKTAVGKPAKAAKTASTKASHKAPSKQLIKSVPSAPPKATLKATPKTAAEATHKATPKPTPGTALAEGAMAPAFHLPRDGGGSVSLADYAGRKLVLFFYPRADTPGCTREAIDFTRLSDAFAEEGATVLGISADSVKAQESFRSKHQLSVPLISDEQHEMLEAYGAWGEKSMYGRSFMGIIRTTVVIGADGRIAKIWRHVRVDGHADEVLATVRGM